MNWLDIVILVVIVIFAFTGIKNGLISTLLNLVGLIVGVVLAGRFHTFLGDSTAAQIIAFVIVLVVVLLVFMLVARILKRILHLVMMGWLDKLLGAVVGIAFGGIICGAILALLGQLSGIPIPGAADWIQSAISDSALAKFLLDKFPLILSLLPDQFNVVRDFFK